MTASTPRRALAIGVAISTLAHALAVLWLIKGDGVAGAQIGAADEGDEIVVDFDVTVAPEAPEAFEPATPEEDVAPVEDEVAAAEAEAELALVDEAADEVADDEVVAGDEVADAGVVADEDVADAGAVADVEDTADAGAVADVEDTADAGAVAANEVTDAGAVAAAKADDAGASAAAASDAPAWSRLAHDDHAPAGDHIAVALHLARLRGTEWAEHTAAILAPMPDYRTLVGDRDIAVADLFDVFWMSSSDPSDVGATNLAAKSTLPRTKLRSFLDHPRAHVTWSSARGGALGNREPSALIHPGDSRVFFIPFDPWVLLADTDALGDLPAAEAGNPDLARAPAELLPTWVSNLEAFDAAIASDRDLILWASVTDLPARLPVLGGATLPGPSRVLAALSLEPTGFFLRGTLSFASPDRAAAFERDLLRARTELTSSWKGRALLSSLHARNALDQLSLRRRGDQVAFSTSLSVADARAAMRLAADWSRRFFDPKAHRKR